MNLLKFSDLKVGDKVFVVRQRRRFCDRPKETFEAEVEKIGRKYGYIKAGFFRGVFYLKNGASYHAADNNARVNGFGFDVFASEEVYLQEQRRIQEFARLRERLVDRYGRLHRFSPHVVELMHQLLDEEGLD